MLMSGSKYFYLKKDKIALHTYHLRKVHYTDLCLHSTLKKNYYINTPYMMVKLKPATCNCYT